ncbi:MAG: ABC transporter permease [Anaerolineae bacterium]|nr:ABC transporter permease [Anaerolineae bacterium]
MLGFKLERGSAPLWLRGLIPILAIVLTFALVSILIVFAGANPLDAINQLLIIPLTKNTARGDIMVMATPLLLTGASVAFAFASGYYNIGAEGQLYAGAIAGAWLGPQLQSQPPLIAITIMLIGGFIAGALWALPPALLKVRLGVDEVVTTLLLNSVMLFIVSALLNGPWRDPTTGWPQSPTIAESAQFPILVARSRIHFGFIVAIVAIIVLWWIFKRTRFGLELRSAGMGKEAAHFMGVHVNRVMLTAAIISGGVAGLAGLGEIAGIHHHLVEAISPGYGYTGIIIATLGGLTAPGVALAGLFIALLERGALSANRELNVPVYLGDVIQAVLLITTLALLLLNRYRLRRVR